MFNNILIIHQLEEYNQLKENAGRQTAVLQHQLDAVSKAHFYV